MEFSVSVTLFVWRWLVGWFVCLYAWNFTLSFDDEIKQKKGQRNKPIFDRGKQQLSKGKERAIYLERKCEVAAGSTIGMWSGRKVISMANLKFDEENSENQ